MIIQKISTLIIEQAHVAKSMVILQQQKKFALTLHKILDIQIAKINEQLTNENPYSLRSHDFCNINQISFF